MERLKTQHSQCDTEGKKKEKQSWRTDTVGLLGLNYNAMVIKTVWNQ